MSAAGLGLAAPPIVAAQGTRVLKFIPHADLTVLDPIWTTAYVTRNHGYLVYDTLFGMDNAYAVSPQMAAGLTVENDGKLVRITLRDGLKFHDGERVLARDCAASIRRWGTRDTFGQSLMAATDELAAPDDRTIQFRLKHAFALLPDALAKAPSNFAAMMPERLAKTDPFTQITEVVGSGPSGSWPGNAMPATSSSMSSSPTMCRARRAWPTAPPVPRWRISIASNGASSPMLALPRRRCKTAKWTGGSRWPATTATCCARRASMWPPSIPRAPWGACG